MTLTPEPHQLTLPVFDSGQGLDSASAFSTMDGHFGLIGMRERARVIGATVEVCSTPGCGTTVRVTVPAARA